MFYFLWMTLDVLLLCRDSTWGVFSLYTGPFGGVLSAFSHLANRKILRGRVQPGRTSSHRRAMVVHLLAETAVVDLGTMLS